MGILPGKELKLITREVRPVSWPYSEGRLPVRDTVPNSRSLSPVRCAIEEGRLPSGLPPPLRKESLVRVVRSPTEELKEPDNGDDSTIILPQVSHETNSQVQMAWRGALLASHPQLLNDGWPNPFQISHIDEF